METAAICSDAADPATLEVDGILILNYLYLSRAVFKD